MKIKIFCRVLFFAIPLVSVSESCFAWGSAEPKSSVTGDSKELRLFSFTRGMIEQKMKRKNTDPLADLYSTTSFPFFLISDLVMSPSMTTVLLADKLNMQKHPAAWNNPDSMIAKASQAEKVK